MAGNERELNGAELSGFLQNYAFYLREGLNNLLDAEDADRIDQAAKLLFDLHLADVIRGDNDESA